MAKKKFYVVWQGRNTGVYNTWEECKKQVDGYAQAKYKSFTSKSLAENAFKEGYESFLGTKKTDVKKVKTVDSDTKPIWQSISVDASSMGNPGIMEYRGVQTDTGKEIFRRKYGLGTNNIGEFLAIVHALALFKQKNIDLPIYTDSKIAMSWVQKKVCKTTLEQNEKTKYLFEDIAKAITWLENNDYSHIQLVKWDTKNWGEIPADFGRK